MNLYDLNQEIQSIERQMMDWAEAHDGDVTEFPMEAIFGELVQEKEKNLVQLGMWYKNQIAYADAIDNEIANLKKRQDVTERKAERIKQFVGFILGEGNKLNDPKVVLSWRKSKALKLLKDAAEIPSEYLRIKPEVREADKKAITEAIESGKEFDFAILENKQNIQIK